CDARRDAEGVVDRRADVAVGGGEERRCPEDAFEPLLSSAPRHPRSLETRGAGSQPTPRCSPSVVRLAGAHADLSRPDPTPAGVVNELTVALPAATIASGFVVSNEQAASEPMCSSNFAAAWRPRIA